MSTEAATAAQGADQAATRPQGIWRIDAERLWDRLMALARIGATPGGGVDRQALSAEEIASWHAMIDWALSAGLEPSTDAAGNLFIALPGTDRDAPPVLAGSHLDSQPGGGRFDGVYGVVAALEVLTTLAQRGVRPPVDIVCVAWMNEEGSRFAPGMMGSEAFAGVRSMEEVRAARDAKGVCVADALDALHAAFPALRRRPLGFALAAYVEAHIEQGPILEAEVRVIGVVTGIQGKKTFDIVIEGERGHAGTLAMADRRDALQAFSRIAMALYAQVGGHDAAVKFTIGRMVVEPNAPSVVPERVSLRIDLRHPDNAVLTLLGERLAALCETLAAMRRDGDAAGRRAFQRLRRRPAAGDCRRRRAHRPAAHADSFGGRPRRAPHGAAVPERDDLHSLPRRREPRGARMGRARARGGRRERAAAGAVAVCLAPCADR
jgi:N-carbamoyl-L-amino-acid hydrolase